MLLAHYPYNSFHDWHFEILFIVAIIVQLIHILLEASRRTTARDRLAVERSTYDPERRAAAASSVESRSRRSPLAAALPPIAPAVEVSSRNHDRPPRPGNACFGAPGRLG